MSNFQTRALNIINYFSKIVPELTDDVTKKADYIYFRHPDEPGGVDVCFYAVKEHLPAIQQGLPVTFEELVEAILICAQITDASQELKDIIYYEVENSFGFQYFLAREYLPFAKKELMSINEEAGETILNPWVLDSMLAGATEFYESSRCW